MIKLKSKKIILVILLCICAAICAVLSCFKTISAEAYESADMPTGTNAIGNLVKSIENNGEVKFDTANFKALAKKVGYSSIKMLADDAVKDNFNPLTSADFGETVVKFGSYTFNGTKHELTWIPVYVSNATVDEDGDGIPDLDENGNENKTAILTLWLAGTESSNTATSSNQEVSFYSNGTTSTNSGKLLDSGIRVYSNTYDISYIRNYVLNGSDDYLKESFGTGTVVTPPAASTMTKFAQFVNGGALSRYVVKPCAVSWQKTASYTKNDPEWDVANNTYGKGENYPSDWLNDNLWLPSVYEVSDNTIAKNSTATTFKENGGLWQTGDNSTTGRHKRSNSQASWLRSSYSTGYTAAHTLNGSSGYATANSVRAVRPALHLNLSIIELCKHQNLTAHPKVTYCENDGYEAYWECTVCDSLFSDSEAKTEIEKPVKVSPAGHTLSNIPAKQATCKATGNSEYWECSVCKKLFSDSGGATEITTGIPTIPTLSHDFTSSPWSSNPTNHWKECARGCGDTDTATAHTFQWVVDTPATVIATGVQHEECTTCKFAKSQGTVIPIVTCNHPNTMHTAAVAATCVATGNVEYWHCNDCGKYLDASSVVITNTTTAIDPNNHSFTNYVYNNDATCTLDGTETATCDRNCGATDTRTKTGTMLNHDFNNAPWSTGTSNHWHVCTRTGCNDTDTPAAHTFQWVIDTAATVTSSGIKHEECTVCGYAQSQGTVIPVLTCAHNNKTHYPAVAATCSQQGNVEYWYCSDCLKNVDQAGQELTTVTTPIDSANHSFTTYVSNNNATCTADGTKTAQCDHGCGAEDTVTDTGTMLPHSYTNYVSNNDATCNADGTKTAQCDYGCGAEDTVADTGSMLPHNFTTYTVDGNATCTADGTKTATCDYGCGATDTITDTGSAMGHNYAWVITKEPTVDETGLMENLCTVCGNKDGEEEIAKLIDPNGEIDLPVDINVEFKVTQSSTDNDYSDIDKGLKRGYWAQLWYRNEDGTLGDEFTDKINCFLTLKIPTEIIEAIRGGEEINRDKIAAGLKVYYIDGEGAPVEVDNFTIAMRDDDSWQIKFNYNEKFRAEVVFAADLDEPISEQPTSGIPWWVWLLVILGSATLLAIIIVIIVVAKKKKNDNTPSDNGELLSRLDSQEQKIDELLGRDDGGFNTPVELDKNGNVIFK